MLTTTLVIPWGIHGYLPLTKPFFHCWTSHPHGWSYDDHPQDAQLGIVQQHPFYKPDSVLPVVTNTTQMAGDRRDPQTSTIGATECRVLLSLRIFALLAPGFSTLLGGFGHQGCSLAPGTFLRGVSSVKIEVFNDDLSPGGGYHLPMDWSNPAMWPPQL